MPDGPSSPRLTRYAHLLAPAALALVLGLWGIRRGGTLWADEAVTLEIARRDVSEIWQTLGTVDAVHGLYYLLMHGLFALWDQLSPEGGPGLVALRLPSVLATAAAAAGVGALGARLAGRRVGLLAGLVFPLLPVVQRYAQEGRSYALVCALVTWATWILLRAVDRPGRRRLWAGYAALLLAASLLHEFAVLALLAHAVTVARSAVPAGAKRAWLLAACAVVAGLAPLGLFSLTQSAQIDWIGPPKPPELLLFAILSAAGVACAYIASASRRTPTRTRTRTPIRLPVLALPLLVLPSALLIALAPLRHLYVDRYVLFYAVGLALLAAAALDRLTRLPRHRLVPYATTVLASAAALVALVPAGVQLRGPESRKNDAVAIAEAVRETARPGDGLMFMPSRRRVWTLVRPADFRGLTDLALHRSPRASHTLYGTELPAAEIRERVPDFRRIVAVHDVAGQPLDDTDQEEAKRAALREAYEVCGTRRVTGAQITVYARPGAC
ncbi:glycosyltransferase family 39 protein [Streptomyces sp. NBC_01511]|uniref:glycosyltransferase family 39 protein n=1 Tax=Streptomyces sp. NBC_01511 TaxID=2903889 RepID=UPI0038644842